MAEKTVTPTPETNVSNLYTILHEIEDRLKSAEIGDALALVDQAKGIACEQARDIVLQHRRDEHGAGQTGASGADTPRNSFRWGYRIADAMLREIDASDDKDKFSLNYGDHNGDGTFAVFRTKPQDNLVLRYLKRLRDLGQHVEEGFAAMLTNVLAEGICAIPEHYEEIIANCLHTDVPTAEELRGIGAPAEPEQVDPAQTIHQRIYSQRDEMFGAMAVIDVAQASIDTDYNRCLSRCLGDAYKRFDAIASELEVIAMDSRKGGAR